MTIPLTAENARVGAKVLCVDAADILGSGAGLIQAGRQYEIKEFREGHVYLTGIRHGYVPRRFVLADPPAPTMTPELLAALREWGTEADRRYPVGGAVYASSRLVDQLLSAIRTTPGILEPPPPPPPGVTDVRATLAQEWWV